MNNEDTQSTDDNGLRHLLRSLKQFLAGRRPSEVAVASVVVACLFVALLYILFRPPAETKDLAGGTENRESPVDEQTVHISHLLDIAVKLRDKGYQLQGKDEWDELEVMEKPLSHLTRLVPYSGGVLKIEWRFDTIYPEKDPIPTHVPVSFMRSRHTGRKQVTESHRHTALSEFESTMHDVVPGELVGIAFAEAVIDKGDEWKGTSKVHTYRVPGVPGEYALKVRIAEWEGEPSVLVYFAYVPADWDVTVDDLRVPGGFNGGW
jgi:hypothetical protein